MMNMKKANGFTLIEMLVALMVVAVMLPVAYRLWLTGLRHCLLLPLRLVAHRLRLTSSSMTACSLPDSVTAIFGGNPMKFMCGVRVKTLWTRSRLHVGAVNTLTVIPSLP